MKIAAAALMMVAAIGLQVVRGRAYDSPAPDDASLLYVESPRVLDRLVLGFDAVVADLYWIRAIQHYGANRLAIRQRPTYDLLYPLLDMTTGLDPYFNIAYRFGAIFLSEPYPGGAGRPDLAIALLKKAIAAQPTRWHYYHDLGFVHYWTLQDPGAAALWFRRAAALPDAPNWLLPVAAATLSESGDRNVARQLWRQILQADEAWLRNRAARGLQQLDALDRIDELTKIVQAASRPAGEPFTWAALVRAGVLRAVPMDPAGTPFHLDPATGRVSVAGHSPLFPLQARRGERR